MGVAGSVISATSSTTVTLPESNMTIIGATVYAATTGGYLSIPVDSTRSAIIGFRPSIGVTTTDVPQASFFGPIQAFHFKTTGSTLNYVGVGLSSGTFIFYYGTPMNGSIPLGNLTAIVSSFTTGNPAAFTFPAGPITLEGIACILGVSNVQTGIGYRFAWNTSAGKSVTVHFQMNDPCDINPAIGGIVPLEHLPAAQSLTVTGTQDGTHVGTGYLIIYYSL